MDALAGAVCPRGTSAALLLTFVFLARPSFSRASEGVLEHSSGSRRSRGLRLRSGAPSERRDARNSELELMIKFSCWPCGTQCKAACFL